MMSGYEILLALILGAAVAYVIDAVWAQAQTLRQERRTETTQRWLRDAIEEVNRGPERD